MEQITFQFNEKDIPCPSNGIYLSMLVSMILTLSARVRWKLAMFKNPEWNSSKETYGFKTTNPAPRDDDLKLFEELMLDIPNKIKFHNPNNAYQKVLKEDIKRINRQNKVIVKSDKTKNYYLVEPDEYRKLMADTISKDYKKANYNVVDIIDREASKIATKLDLENRIDKFRLQEPFITIKDHKESFPGRVETRLINPGKSNIGVISKKLLDKINITIRESIEINQWRSTQNVLEWFDKIPNKRNKKFFQFDIVSFYPSINEELFKKLLEFARRYINISKDEEDILRNARKQILSWNGKFWRKKDGSLFDVSMGSPDGAELCELAGLYCLSILRSKLPAEDIGLYRDDGLGVSSKSGPGMSKIEKTLHSVFKEMGLKITTIMNIKKVEFLDVILDLSTGKTYPYRKPLDNPTYVNILSSHPPSVTKQIPRSVQDRLSMLSSSKEEFDNAAPPYRDALKKAGYNTDIEFSKPETTKRKNRGRKKIWFNPPFSLTVKTNVTKLYGEIIEKAFPAGHPYLRKLFNKNNMGISYSTTQNMGAIISSHNKKILKEYEEKDTVEEKCSCNDEVDCPLEGKCLETEIVYQATASSTDGSTKFYTGLTEPKFKLRFNNHKKSLTHEKYSHETTLSTHVWDKKKEGFDCTIKWKILKKAKAYNSSAAKCHLCLAEKVEILKNSKNNDYLNKRSELFTKCRHRKKWLLGSIS